jgi:LuxR family maltose regulon positive regulatory protein
LRSLVERQTTVSQAKPVKGLPEQLTDREYMVLTYLPTRQSNAEIAERLGVSLNTVKTHLKHVYRKLDVVGRSDAVDAAEHMHLL